LQLEEKREETKRSSKVVRVKMQRHEKEERDRKQVATNNMYSLCNELFGELVECFEND
jgi:lipoate synthase